MEGDRFDKYTVQDMDVKSSQYIIWTDNTVDTGAAALSQRSVHVIIKKITGKSEIKILTENIA